MGKILLIIAIIFIVPFILDIIVFIAVNTYLQKRGVDPNKYYEMLGKGEVPLLIPVEVKVKTAKGKIINRWQGRGELGMVAVIEGEEKSFEVTEEEWKTYKTGDEVVFGMQIITNSKTNEVMKNHCKYDILDYAPECDMISSELILGHQILLDKRENIQIRRD